jgi:hypothetical protein
MILPPMRHLRWLDVARFRDLESCETGPHLARFADKLLNPLSSKWNLSQPSRDGRGFGQFFLPDVATYSPERIFYFDEVGLQ